MPLPFPHVFLPDVTHITPALLQQLGVSGLLLDIDGTLMQTRDAMPCQAVLDWMEDMKAHGIILYILSNNKHFDRVKAFAETVGLPWQHLAKKPGRKGFYEAAKRLKMRPEQLAMVGKKLRKLLQYSQDSRMMVSPLPTRCPQPSAGRTPPIMTEGSR